MYTEFWCDYLTILSKQVLVLEKAFLWNYKKHYELKSLAMRTRKQENLPFRRRASFKEASSFSRRSMRKTSSFSLTLALYALAIGVACNGNTSSALFSFLKYNMQWVSATYMFMIQIRTILQVTYRKHKEEHGFM